MDKAGQVEGLWAGVRRNFIAGLRLLALRRPQMSDFVANGDQIIVFALMGVGVAVVSDYLAIDGTAEFNSWGLLTYATSYLLMILGAYLVARWHRRTEQMVPFLVVLLCVDLGFEVAVSVFAGGFDPAELTLAGTALGVLLIWVMAVWWRAVGIVFSIGRRKTLGTVVLVLGVSGLPQWWFPSNDLWYEEYAGYEETRERVNTEAVYYSQPRVLQSALDALLPERPGTVDLYHVGFGSYAPQAVFRREVQHVRHILDSRFDTQGRSLALINSPETVADVPLASGSNLRRALEGVGHIMNPEEDVLLLYLTSHGSKNAQLAVDFWPLNLNPLTAQALKQMLDEAGIRWRVIVISACYSGSFIDQLKDDRTVVITAAAKDKTSFGCTNENEYTYFGEAYFKQALGQTRSFIEAFDIAKNVVTAREQSEGLDPSHPTLFMGEAAGAHLRRLEARLPSAAAHGGGDTDSQAGKEPVQPDKS